MISILIVLCVIYYTAVPENSIEPFQAPTLSACPNLYKIFYDSNGDTMCCDGEIIANKCMGSHQCTLHGKGSGTSCVDMVLQDYETKSKSQCPASMNHYFEDKPNNVKGCTESELNDTLTGPKNDKRGMCIIYDTLEQNTNAINSCHNQKQMEDYPCFGNNCTKALVQPISDKPVLISIRFIDSSGIHRTSYTRTSIEAHLNSTTPNWRDKGVDLSKNIQVTEVAKAVYVDKTMSASEVQL